MVLKKVLIHCCCVHCAAYTIHHWRSQGYEVSGLWYNPNIHPYLEHQSRLEAMAGYARQAELPLLVIDGYDMVDYFRKVVGREADRCRYCYRLRLAKTAETANFNHFNAFTTTLLISSQQKHDVLVEVGNKIALETGIEFLSTDLRKRYSDSRVMTKPLNLYRQQYCGCIYSKWERYSRTD